MSSGGEVLSEPLADRGGTASAPGAYFCGWIRFSGMEGPSRCARPASCRAISYGSCLPAGPMEFVLYMPLISGSLYCPSTYCIATRSLDDFFAMALLNGDSRICWKLEIWRAFGELLLSLRGMYSPSF